VACPNALWALSLRMVFSLFLVILRQPFMAL